jgi:hypothetical protein
VRACRPEKKRRLRAIIYTLKLYEVFFKYIRLSTMYNNLWDLYTDPRIFQFSLRHKIMLLAERAPICRAKDCSFYPHITYFFVIETFIKPRGLDMS